MLVPVRNILLIETSGHYTRIFFKERIRTGSVSPRESLRRLETHLPEYFLRISRFQIINTNEIVYITSDILFFTGNLQIPLKGKRTYLKIDNTLNFRTQNK